MKDVLEWSFHGNLCRTIGPLMLHSQEISNAGAIVPVACNIIINKCNPPVVVVCECDLLRLSHEPSGSEVYQSNLSQMLRKRLLPL